MGRRPRKMQKGKQENRDIRFREKLYSDICLEKVISNPKFIPCGQVFYVPCLYHWLKEKPIPRPCPQFNQQIDQKKINFWEQCEQMASSTSSKLSSPNLETGCGFYDFIRDIPGCEEYAEIFFIHEVDGEALVVLTPDHMLTATSAKLGSVKLIAKVNDMKSESESQDDSD